MASYEVQWKNSAKKELKKLDKKVIIRITSKISSLFPGEFAFAGWKQAGLNVPTAVKRGMYTIEKKLVRKTIGKLQLQNIQQLEKSLKSW